MIFLQNSSGATLKAFVTSSAASRSLEALQAKYPVTSYQIKHKGKVVRCPAPTANTAMRN